LELVAKVTLWLNVRLASQVYVAYKKAKEEIDRLRLPSQTKATIFTNAVNPSLFQLLSMKEARGKLALELKESDFVVGFVGSMKERHCLPPLLDAVAQIKKENKYIKLLMVGNGPQLDELREIVRYKGLEKTVIFTDFIPHNQVYLYMAACDVLYGVVDPNEVSNPIKCYEYLACERPIITSQRDEFYFVKKHNLGISLESVESAKIADAIRNLLAIDREERLKMGRVGRDYVVKHHIWDQLVELILGDVDL
jgi:glycosyltransferase involved in cell wall biosynthesis